jgi:uncharacterized protein YdeI (BOF family)
MKKLAILLIAGALVSPAFAEPRSANTADSHSNAQAVAGAKAAADAQPAA